MHLSDESKIESAAVELSADADMGRACVLERGERLAVWCRGFARGMAALTLPLTLAFTLTGCPEDSGASGPISEFPVLGGDGDLSDESGGDSGPLVPGPLDDSPMEGNQTDTSVGDPSEAVGLSCGGNDCEDIVTPLGALAACCAGDGGLRCGNNTDLLVAVGFPGGCVASDQAGFEDAACLPITIDIPMLGDVTLEGCCREDGSCGAVLDDVMGVVQLGFGCVDPVAVLGVTAVPENFPVASEWPLSCGATAGMGMGDAGAGVEGDAGAGS